MPVNYSRFDETILEDIQYKSVPDYIKGMNKKSSIADMLAYSTGYILAHGNNGNRDYSLAEFIHFAQMKIADESIKLRKSCVFVDESPDVDPLLENKKDDELNQLFMGRPGDYILGEASYILEGLNQKPVLSENEEKLRRNCEALLELDPMIINEQVARLNEKSNTMDVEARLESKYGGSKQLDKAYNATRPGILSRMFDTSSLAYKNLDKVYLAFNNPNHALYGNLNALGKAATEYIQHRFPDWDPKSGLPSPIALRRLGGTEKARTEFSINILLSVAEQKKIEGEFKKLTDNCLDKASDMLMPENQPVEENAQLGFQQGLQEDIAQNNDLDFDQEEAERAYHNVFEIGPEENDGMEP